MSEVSRGRRIPSPCVDICTLDDATGWCIGCGRTIEEIVRWGSTHHTDRTAVMAQLPGRKRKLSGAR